MSEKIYDVVQVGYGPVSQALAIMLGRQGRKVAVFERWPEPYTLPRAVCVDHEIFRMLHAIGCGEELARITHPAPLYQWFNADWKELISVDWTAESVSGGPSQHFVHQPTLERVLDRKARAFDTVEVNRGWEAVDLQGAPDHVVLTVRHMESGETREVRSRYLIGADGANSFVRKSLRIEREDRGFQADWLIADVELNEGVTLDIPACGQYCNPERPTTIVPGGIHDGRWCRRWEFMRLPDETLEEFESTDNAWRLLSAWVKPDQATLVRHAVYTFRSLIAETWHRKRVLIAGDAAHVMPPFMGQGMCAGLRDGWNLSWKLGMVLDGRADDSLLDTYTAERKPHVRDVVDMSIHMGRIICIPDPVAAAARDKSYFEGTAPPPPFPQLVDGLLHRDALGRTVAPAGMLGPHGTVAFGGREGRWDDVVGQGFAVIARGINPREALRPDQLSALEELGAHLVEVVQKSPAGLGAAGDLDGKYMPFLEENGLAAMIVRPDFYLFGGVAMAAELPELVDALFTELAVHGVGRLLQAPSKLHAA